MKQFIDDNGQEWGFDIGDAHFFADEEMTIELPTRAFSKEQIAQIMGGVPIIRCKDCKHFREFEKGFSNDWDGSCKYWNTHSTVYSNFCGCAERKEE